MADRIAIRIANVNVRGLYIDLRICSFESLYLYVILYVSDVID